MTPYQQLDFLVRQPSPDNGVRESIIAAGLVDAAPKKKLRHYILILRALHYECGRTDDQICEFTGIPPNSLRPRRGELFREGLLQKSPGGKSHAGNPACRWLLTDAGIETVHATAHLKLGKL